MKRFVFFLVLISGLCFSSVSYGMNGEDGGQKSLVVKIGETISLRAINRILLGLSTLGLLTYTPQGYKPMGDATTFGMVFGMLSCGGIEVTCLLTKLRKAVKNKVEKMQDGIVKKTLEGVCELTPHLFCAAVLSALFRYMQSDDFKKVIMEEGAWHEFKFLLAVPGALIVLVSEVLLILLDGSKFYVKRFFSLHEQ